MFTLPNAIRNEVDAKSLVDWCLEHIGLGYHPDTLAADDIDDSGQQSFTETLATKLDDLHDEAFEAGYSGAMYEYGLSRMHEIVENTPVEVF